MAINKAPTLGKRSFITEELSLLQENQTHNVSRGKEV